MSDRDCQHGQLPRVCDRCADAAEIERLRAELAASREREARMRDAIDAAANIIGDAPWWCDIWAAHDKGAQG